jgi:hypothetical protein
VDEAVRTGAANARVSVLEPLPVFGALVEAMERVGASPATIERIRASLLASDAVSFRPAGTSG